MTRGEIWWTDLGIPYGSEPGFMRPTLIIQDNTFNKSRIRTIIVLSITSNIDMEDAPGNVFLNKQDSGLSKDSVINVSQIATIDRKRFTEKVSILSEHYMSEVEEGLRLVLGLDS